MGNRVAPFGDLEAARNEARESRHFSDSKKVPDGY
jgi:hypothetical protein